MFLFCVAVGLHGRVLYMFDSGRWDIRHKKKYQGKKNRDILVLLANIRILLLFLWTKFLTQICKMFHIFVLFVFSPSFFLYFSYLYISIFKGDNVRVCQWARFCRDPRLTSMLKAAKKRKKNRKRIWCLQHKGRRKVGKITEAVPQQECSTADIFELWSTGRIFLAMRWSIFGAPQKIVLSLFMLHFRNCLGYKVRLTLQKNDWMKKRKPAKN